MESSDRQTIDRYVDQLVSLVDMEKLWPKLINVIFFPDYPEIPKWESNWNDSEVKKTILLEIKTRGPRAFQHLINGLKESGQHRCVEILQNNSDGPNCPPENRSSSTIQVRKSTRFCDVNSNANPIGTYRMRSNPRGLVLIISLIKYSTPENDREAAEHDEKNLIDLFEQMGFKVQPERDLTTEEIRMKIKEFSLKPELQFVDSAFIIIGGHGDINLFGNDTLIYGINLEDPGISCNEIIGYFVPEKCEYLKNKPKIFIFQVCRGKNEQIVSTSSYKNTPFRFKMGIGETSSDYSDMFIAHSTLPDCVAYLNVTMGSWFIQKCCEIFAKFAYKHHVEDLFILVDGEIKTFLTYTKMLGDNTACQTSSLKNCSFKHCFINPGLFEDTS